MLFYANIKAILYYVKNNEGIIYNFKIFHIYIILKPGKLSFGLLSGKKIHKHSINLIHLEYTGSYLKEKSLQFKYIKIIWIRNKMMRVTLKSVLLSDKKERYFYKDSYWVGNSSKSY